MPKTQKLNLELTNNSSITFEQWRKSINGVGDGISTPKSNFQLIDDYLANLPDNNIIKEYSTRSHFPATGDKAHLYVDVSSGDVYFWATVPAGVFNTTSLYKKIVPDEPVVQIFHRRNQFPGQGKEKYLYHAMIESLTYFWSNTTSSYISLYEEDTIDGGTF